MPAKRVEAAGGVLWRAARDGVVVGLVHRPRYDDDAPPPAYWVAHFTHSDEPRLAGLERFACAT